MIKGFAALSRRAQFTPYVMGDQFTIADVYFLYSVDLAAQVAKKLFDLDLLGDMPQARALLELLAKRPSVQKVAAERFMTSRYFWSESKSQDKKTGASSARFL